MYANTLSSCSTLSARSYDTLFHFPRWCQGLYLVLFSIVRYGWKCSVQSLFVCPPKIKWKTNKNRQQQHEIEFNLLVIIAVQVTTGGKLADTWKCSVCENTRLYSKLNGCALLCYAVCWRWQKLPTRRHTEQEEQWQNIWFHRSISNMCTDC